MYSKIYKAENISGIEYFQQELKSIGKIQSSERNAIIVLAAMTVYLFTSQWHKMDMTYGFAVAAVLLFFPACKIAGMKDFKRVDMGFPMLVASCMAIGNVATAVGAGAAISNFIIPFLQTANSSFLFVITTWTSGVLANLLMTPMALYTLIAPVMGPIAEAFGYSPKIVAYLLYHTGNQVFFPYENNTILMMYGFGMMNMRQFCKGAIAKMILDLFFVCTIGFGYWKLIGLL